QDAGSPFANTGLSIVLNSANPQHLSLAVNNSADHVINAIEATNVGFTVTGLNPNETATVTFADADNLQVTMKITADGSYSADLSSLADGTITSSLAATTQSDHATSIAGNAITLDTDRDLTPTITVDAANPTNVSFTVDGLEGDEHGTVTFTDTNGLQDV